MKKISIPQISTQHYPACKELTNTCFCLLLIFSKIHFLKKIFNKTIRDPNSLDPDQARRFVGPDLGPNCLQRISADDISRLRDNNIWAEAVPFNVSLPLIWKHEIFFFCFYQKHLLLHKTCSTLTIQVMKSLTIQFNLTEQL